MTLRTSKLSDGFSDLGNLVHKFIAKMANIGGFPIIQSISGHILLIGYTTPVYNVSATVLIKEPKDGSNSAAELLYGTQIFRSSKDLINESILLKSYSHVASTLGGLDVLVTYLAEGNIKSAELYTNSPISVEFDSASYKTLLNVPFKCTITSNNTYELSTEGNSDLLESQNRSQYKFGERVYLEHGGFVITKKQDYLKPESIIFRLNDVDRLTKSYRSNLLIAPVEKEASILKVSIEGITPNKEIDVLNNLISLYIEKDLDEKTS